MSEQVVDQDRVKRHLAACEFLQAVIARETARYERGDLTAWQLLHELTIEGQRLALWVETGEIARVP